MTDEELALEARDALRRDKRATDALRKLDGAPILPEQLGASGGRLGTEDLMRLAAMQLPESHPIGAIARSYFLRWEAARKISWKVHAARQLEQAVKQGRPQSEIDHLSRELESHTERVETMKLELKRAEANTRVVVEANKEWMEGE